MSTFLQDFVQRAPVDTLRLYFDAVSPAAAAAVDWKTSRPTIVSQLVGIVAALDDERRDRIYGDLDRIGQFVGQDHGRRMLRAVLPADGRVHERFDALADITACAVYVLLRDDDGFENALSALYAQRLLNGRDWTGFDFDPSDDEPAMLPEPDTELFTSKLRKIFAADGPEPRVSVGRFTRRDPDPAGGGTLTRDQFTIYFESPPTAELAFDAGGKVEPRTARPVREAALLLDVAERTLDVVAKGPVKEQRRRMAEAFVETMLAPGTALAARSRRNLALDRLKHRPNFAVLPDDRVRRVSVTKLRLGAPDFGSIATLEVPGRGRRDEGPDIYDHAAAGFGPRGIPGRRGWRVIAAKLRVEFEPERPKARAKSVTFELKMPDRTNLRDQIEAHRRIADTLLARWGLYDT